MSDKCYFCHGPDEGTRQADLRLDKEASAAIVVNSGDFLDRVLSDDPDLHMPPADSNLTLSANEKETLKRWVAEGAHYDGHWAFKRLPRDIPVPSVRRNDWAKTTLDQFVLRRIEEADYSPSQEAAPSRWLRRVTLDLTGLPPTVSAIKNFEQRLKNEGREQTYQATVDELLASPAFGEHMAVAWLDAARYADSYGYQSDKLNTQWPYRDWVVRAFNENVPYDDFLKWQLAGDLLPNPTRDQLVATAFNRIHRLNNEGGAVFEEWRIENVSDRVHTFGTAVLGLTMECCRCHDHKYDPLPMREYYSLSAFFNSIDESGVYDRTQKVPCPSLLLPTPEQTQSLKATKQLVQSAERTFEETVGKAHDDYRTWRSVGATEFNIPDLRLALSFDREFDNSLKSIYHPSQSDRSWAPSVDLLEIDDCKLRRMPASEAQDGDNKDAPRRALHLDGERGITTSGIEPFDRWAPFTVVVSMKEQQRVPERSLIAHHTRGTDCGYNGWDLTIVDGYVESRLYRVWPGNAIGVRTTNRIPVNQWHQIAATYDGSSLANGLKLHLNGQELPTAVLRNNIKKSANVKVDHGGEFVVGQRFRARGLAHGLIDDVRVFLRDLTPNELQYLATGEIKTPSFTYFVSAISDKCRNARKVLTSARRKFVMAEEAIDEIPIMKETAPRIAHILARGQYDAPTDENTRVEREVPSALGIEFPKDAPRDRLGLAEWVIHPEHPLTSRVAVNRLWGNFFSAPLVTTPENFGAQGAIPTHPELLDWLSRDFVDNGWNVKRFCRNVVLSATYRQDSSTDEGALDPENRLLARGPAYRLAAEQIRDIALAASGLLNKAQGGPPVSPYQPGGDLWRESNGMSPAYEQSVGRALYRRSLYSVWKRTVPLPNMMAFDATTREVCSVKRARTNTPLQALVLMNDVQFVEACRHLAQRILSEHADEPNQIQTCFITLTGRSPDRQEMKLLQTLYADEREWYAANPETAGNLLSNGESPVSPSTDATTLAALTTVCQTILNLDATIWKR